MKVAIIGCGEISKKHISFIKQLGNADIVGLIDRDDKRLKEMAERYEIKDRFASLDDLVKKTKVDVVHVLTPPKYHKELAMDAIDKGIHVYIEKPIALNQEETSAIYAHAEKMKVMVCAGYNHLFDPCFKKADDLIKQGEIGKVVHIESHYGMNVLRKDLKMTTRENVIHWSYDLPGGLFQNYIDHPLYPILKYTGKVLQIDAFASSSGILAQGLSDELRVSIKGENGTGSMMISFTENPKFHFVHVFGTKGCIKINFDTMSTIVLKNPAFLPKAATKATFNLSEAYQLFSNTFGNTIGILSGRLKPYQGMKNLIGEYHKTIIANGKSPISSNLVLEMSKTIDQIWKQIDHLHLDFTNRKSKQKNVGQETKVLITGASGFLGLHTVKHFMCHGYYVRAFVRKLSKINQLEKMGAEICFGDIRDEESLEKAIRDMDIVIHLAADTSGDPGTSEEITVDGTANLINLSIKHKINKIIYMSSMSVYDTVHAKDGEVFTEASRLEPSPAKRGAYAESKSKAEEYARKEFQKASLPYVILRPAMIFGKESNKFFGPIGAKVGNKAIIVFGRGYKKIRLVHAEDVVEAIRLAIETKKSNGQVYNIVNPEMTSKREYLEKYYCPAMKIYRIIYFPDVLLKFLVVLQMMVFRLIRKKPVLTLYRLNASQKEIHFTSYKAEAELGWAPQATICEQLEEMFEG